MSMEARARILVIEDHSDVREVVRLGLEQAGYEVVEASDSSAGLSLLHGRQMDLVITDLCIPRRGGFPTIKELRRKAPATKIIAISGDTVDVSYGDAPSCAEDLGAMRTLQKPFRLPYMLEVVEEILGC